jgi:hypothetical protein
MIITISSRIVDNWSIARGTFELGDATSCFASPTASDISAMNFALSHLVQEHLFNMPTGDYVANFYVTPDK